MINPKMRFPKISLASLSFIVVLSIASCGIGTTKIVDITGHPRDYAGKEVTVSGEVTETFSLFVVRYFILRDTTGEITVVTDRPLPAKGKKIKVKGVVKEAVSIGTKTSLVLVEGTEKPSR
jgi:aspartyl/asparaginyl-tRNA synthetase